MTSTLTQTVRPLPKASRDQTQAGNYFVANYPPFSFWDAKHVGDYFKALDRPPVPGRPLGLYIHIPFCRKRCHFCYFKVYTDKNSGAIQEYTDALIREQELAASHAFVGGRTPQFVYFGGGTPSYLSSKQLAELTNGLKQTLPWQDVQEVTFECEPGTLNEGKVSAIRDLGVTRLSLGIENFDDQILEANGRAHLSKQVFAAYGWAQKAGFDQINVDLIAGMLQETEAKWIATVGKTIELAPDCVTIYQMEIPFNTTLYKEMAASGKLTAPVADWTTKRRWVKYAFQALEDAGYTITSAYTAVKDPAKTRFVYRDSLWTGADLLSLGVASFGHINQTHYQNQKDYEPYLKAIREGNLPVARALPITDGEALVRQLVLQLKLGHVRPDYFRKTFGVEILEQFKSAFDKYAAAGFLTVQKDQIQLDRDGLLQVDDMLEDFFLPQHQGARYT